ncbi:MAG: putative transcriptional regulator, TetR [Thermogutta sp.]|nr:MAG: putative transcriptional regulator, TetR [Thermogutta sp.]
MYLPQETVVKTRRAKRQGKSPPRGDQTRQRLLEAGIEAFAQFGPEEVGIRRLAAAAGVNSSALSYYFGGKEGYYRAVLRFLIDTVGRSIREAAEAAAQSFRRQPDSTTARQLLRRFMRTVVTVVLTKPYAEAAAAIIWRELLRPSSGFSIVYERMIRPVHELITELTAAAMGTDPDDPQAVLLAHSLWGQAAIFRLGFHVLRRRLKWRGRRLSQEWVDRIADTVEAMVAQLFSSDTPAGTKRNRRRASLP